MTPVRLRIECGQQLHEPHPGYVRCRVTIFGADFHFEAVEIVDDEDGNIAPRVPSECNMAKVDAICQEIEGLPEEMMILGRRFVGHVVPYAQ